jgi:hypothetical protein
MSIVKSNSSTCSDQDIKLKLKMREESGRNSTLQIKDDSYSFDEPDVIKLLEN